MHRIEAYIRLALIFIVVIGVFYLPALFALRKKGKSAIRQISYIGLFCAAFLIVFATILFVPITVPPERYILNLQPFCWIGSTDGQLVVEKLPNILLFIPLGFFIPAVFRSRRKICQTVCISFLVTFSVEFVQYFIGRSADIDDVITNLLGAVIGYVIFKLLNRLLRRQTWWNRFLGNIP